MTTASSTKLDFLQVFRAIAAGVVVLDHMGEELRHHSELLQNAAIYRLRSGAFGVDLFFIISGFIMVYTTRNVSSSARDGWAFFGRRFIRIAPVYWLYMTLFLVSIFFLSNSLYHPQTDVWHIVSSYLFIPSTRPGGAIEPVFGLGWTLNYEMFFYGVFGILLLAPRRYLVPFLAVAFIGLFACGFFVSDDDPVLWYWTRSNLLEFVYGAVIAKLYLRSFTIPVWLCVLAILAGIASWQASFDVMGVQAESSAFRGIIWGLPAALMIGAVALCPEARQMFSNNPSMRFPVMVGNASYSLYLCHMFVVRLISLVLPYQSLGTMYAVIFIPLSLALATGVAYLSYIGFEHPVHQWARRLFHVRGSSVTPQYAKPLQEHVAK